MKNWYRREKGVSGAALVTSGGKKKNQTQKETLFKK